MTAWSYAAPDLRDFAERVQQGAAEEQLFAEAAQAMLAGAPVGDIARFHRFVRAGAYADAAIALYRAVLPEWGFQLGLPPMSDRRQAKSISTSWQYGDHYATPYQASTPALALLGAAAMSRAAEIETESLLECLQCRGLGWYVTADNRKQICRHARHQFQEKRLQMAGPPPFPSFRLTHRGGGRDAS